MKHAYAAGTFKNLRSQWELYFMFCEFYSLRSLPADVNTLCLYAQFLNRSFQSVQSIRNYISGVKTLHNIIDLEYPNSNLFQLNLLLRGIARCKQHIPRKASAITPEILKDIYNFVNQDNTFEVVLWSLFLLMFFLMARKSNMMPNSVSEFDVKKQLTRGDISVRDNMLIIRIKWSKTRQFGHLRQIPISSIPNCCLCPVQAYGNMIRLVNATDNDPAFCYLNKKRQLVPIIYSQFQKQFRKFISCTGRDGQMFSSHSLRRGGCSWGFKSNVKSELLQHHGDWLSDAYKEYLTYDFDQKLSVSRKMSLNIINNV